MPDHEYFGTKVKGGPKEEDRYEWQTLKEVAENAENFSLGCLELGLCPDIEGEGK